MNTKVKRMTYGAVFVCIMILLAQIKITLPGLVPITLQTIGIYMVGCLLPPKEALRSVMLYVIMGAIGFPVFAGYSGGLGVVLGPTGGYITSFPMMAYVISKGAYHKKDTVTIIGSLILGTLLCYTMGTIWFVYTTEASVIAAISWCVLPFLWGDILKIGVVILVAKKINIHID